MLSLSKHLVGCWGTRVSDIFSDSFVGRQIIFVDAEIILASGKNILRSVG